MNADNYPDRLSFLLRGLKPHTWTRRVQIRHGTSNRLIEGNFPDPSRLIPALRIERLSLSWLVDGLGTPYLINAPTSDADAAAMLERHLGDTDWRLDVVSCDVGFSVVLSQPAEAESPNGSRYRYRACEVIGPCCGPLTAARALRSDAMASHVHEVSVEQWQRLATGYMGNTELFGWPDDDDDGGVLFACRAVVTELARVAEPHGDYSAGEVELLHAFRSLDDAERRLLLRMIRGLTNDA